MTAVAPALLPAAERRAGTLCPGCRALAWRDSAGAVQCDCDRPPAVTAAPAPTDHAADCTCGRCHAWRRRQPSHTAIPRAARGERAEPKRFPRDYAPCPCGMAHRPCGLTGECGLGLACGCSLCAGWRRAIGRVQ